MGITVKLKFDPRITRLRAIHGRLEEGRMPFVVVISPDCDYQADEEFRIELLEKRLGCTLV